jgi:hypothetical protein
MFSETSPEISEKELKEEKVKQAFEDLEVEFSWDKNPKILERLAETNEHFADAVAIAKIIEQSWEESEGGLNKKEMLLCGLLHDIGKSGPNQADEETRTVIQKLFIHKNSETSPTLPIAEFLQKENFTDQKYLLQILKEKLNIKPETESMITFWRRHVDWTWDILKNNSTQEITEEVATVAASHHILDQKNPANLDIDNIPESAQFLEITDKYILLTLADKYQAFIERNKKSHNEAIRAIQKMIEQSNLSEKIQKKYFTILKKIHKQNIDI